MKHIERRRFVTVALAGGGSLLLGLQACGGGGDDAGNGNGGLPPELSSCGNSIAGNHSPGHSFTVSVSDLNSTTALSFDIQGLADHPHVLTLTPANLAELKAGRPVTVTSGAGSSTNFPSHTHSITISCS